MASDWADQLGHDIEAGIDRTLAIVGGVVVLVAAAIYDLVRHRHKAK